MDEQRQYVVVMGSSDHFSSECSRGIRPTNEFITQSVTNHDALLEYDNDGPGVQ